MKKILTYTLLLLSFASCKAQIQTTTSDVMRATWKFCAVFDAGIDTTIAYDATCQMNGSISGDYDSILYSTAMTGTFDDATDTNAVFTPSAGDVAAGGGYIRMTAYYYQLSGVDSMLLTITPAPPVGLSLGSDQYTCADEDTLNINGTASGEDSIQIITNGSGTLLADDSEDFDYLVHTSDTTAGQIWFRAALYYDADSLIDTIFYNFVSVPRITEFPSDSTLASDSSIYTIPSDSLEIRNYTTYWWTHDTVSGYGSNGASNGSFTDSTVLAATYNEGTTDSLNTRVNLILHVNNAYCSAITDTMVLTVSSDDYVSEYQEILDTITARGGTLPTGIYVTAQNKLMDSLTTYPTGDPFFDRMPWLHVYAQSSNGEGESLINWINPGTFDGIETSSPTFTSNQGYTGGSSSYILVEDWNPVDYSGSFTQNDASYFVFVLSETDESQSVMGQSAGGTIINNLRPKYNTGTYLARIQGSGIILSTTSTSQGLFTVTRRASDDIEAYQDNTSLASDTDPSTALTDDPWGVLRGGTEYYTGQVGLAGVADGFTDAEVAQLYGFIYEFFEDIGLVPF